LTALEEFTPPPPGRKASKAVRRQQLIDATIVVLARKGFSALTVADVAGVAGLSVGIINFHFDSKEKLLADCLSYMAEEYYQNWQQNLATPGASTAEKMQLVLLGDFDPNIFTPDKLAAWIAFWGETQGRPVYIEICSKYDEEWSRSMASLCEKLIHEGQYRLSAPTVVRALEALSDGLWLGVVSTQTRGKKTTSPVEARQALQAALVAFFPNHFQS
jgi:AcrR family transcriptional regulator